MRWCETRNKANHKKVPQKEKRKLRGKLFHQLSFAARVTHCGSNASQHTHTHARRAHRGRCIRGAYAIFCSKFCGKHRIISPTPPPPMFCIRYALRDSVRNARALLGTVSWVCGIVRTGDMTMYDSPDKVLAHPGLACPVLLTDLSCQSTQLSLLLYSSSTLGCRLLHLILPSCRVVSVQVTRWPGDQLPGPGSCI